MKLKEAQNLVRELDGKSYWYLKEWGISTIKAAIWTIQNRTTSTDIDREYAEGVRLKIALQGG